MGAPKKGKGVVRVKIILCHINVEVAEDSTTTADDVEREVTGLLEIAGDDPDNCPNISSAKSVVVALTEEV